MHIKKMLMHTKKEIIIDGIVVKSKGYLKVDVHGVPEYNSSNKKLIFSPRKIFFGKDQFKPVYMDFYIETGVVEFVEIPPRNTTEFRYDVLKSQKWKCNICGETLKYGKNTKCWKNKTKEEMDKIEVAQIDHLHAYSKMDTYVNGIENINERINLQALCLKCNRNKGVKQIH